MRSRFLSHCLAIVPALVLAGLATPASAACRNLWCQSSAGWSDSGFGSSYSLWTGIETKADHPDDARYDSSYLKAGAEFDVTAKVLGKSGSIANISALAHNDQGETAGWVSIVAAGTELVGAEMSNTITYGFDRTLLKADDSIKLLGVKIRLKGKVTAGLGVDLTPSLRDGAIEMTAAPFANAYASVDASVGASCAKVGVSGNMTALEFDAPVTAAATVTGGGTIGYSVDSAYSLHALDGKIKVKLKLCGTSKSKTIASFHGPTSAGPLVRASGTLSL